MKKDNKTIIKGDNNTSITDVKKSNISFNKNTGLPNRSNAIWTIIGVIVALIALIVQTMIGWSDVIKFFK